VRSGVRLSRAHLEQLAPGRADVGALGRRQRLVVLVICSVSLFMTYVDTTALNVALPSIERDFHASLASIQWVADAYLLVLASLLVAAGSIADRVGRRRVFRTGLVLFTAGSLVCSLAPNVDVLIGLRMLQAVGGCMLTPVSLSIVRQVFTDPSERARALGGWSAIFGLGVAAGPILGGMLVSAAGWRSVFWVNVPIGVGAWWLAGRFVPESRAPIPRRLDPAGQVLVFIVLAALTYAIIEGPSLGWATPRIVGAFAAGAAATILLAVVERSRPEPLLDLRFFRSPPFAAAIATAVLSFLVLAGFLFVTTLYLQDVRRNSPFVAGVSLLPATVMVAVCALFAGQLVARFGARVPLVAAGLCLAAGAAMLLWLTPHTPYALLAPAYVLLGAGFGLVNPPITNTAVSGMPPEQAGVASAIASASRQIGNVLGVAVMGTMVTSSAFGTGHLSEHAAATFTSATHRAWALALACGLACAATAIVCTGRRGLRAARAIYHEQAPTA
jgi:EmrB/QacA subfamily drug resistance transporter